MPKTASAEVNGTWETLEHISQDQLDALVNLHVRYIEGRLGGRRIFLRNTNLSGLSLAGQNLRQAQFMGCTMREMNLAKANFAESALYACDLSGSNLHKASFLRADLRGARIENANLVGADLGHADLREGALGGPDGNFIGPQVVNFQGANLAGARLAGSMAARADFSDAILTQANITKADLRGALLSGADLSGADIGGAELEGADLKAAIMTGIDRAVLEAAHVDVESCGAITDETVGLSVADMDTPLAQAVTAHRLWVETAGAEGRQLDLSGVDMRFLRSLDHEKMTAIRAKGTKFFGMTLTAVEMQSAVLEDSDFRNCDMSAADLRGSSLRGCNFSHAILRGMNGTPLLFGEGAATRRFAPCLFDETVLRYANLTGAMLKNASFRGADLSYADLREADLRAADFTGAILHETLLDGAQTEGATFDRANGLAFRLGALKEQEEV
jgi:uncharacterized protein YjbI with pentapeptide repeats